MIVQPLQDMNKIDNYNSISTSLLVKNNENDMLILHTRTNINIIHVHIITSLCTVTITISDPYLGVSSGRTYT